MKRILLTVLTLCVVLFMNAQEKKSFEGEMTYRNFENHNNLVRKFSKGMAYNGARDMKIIIKGYNIHIIDETMHMHTLLLPNENKAIIYNDLLKRGQQFPFSEYVDSYLSAFSPNTRQVSTVTIPAPEYTIVDTGQKKEYKGEECRIFKGQVIANKGGTTTDVELWVSDKYSIFKCYWYFLNGIQVPGVVMKWTYDLKGKVPMMGKMSSYVASEAKDVIEREVSADEMQVPKGYKIVVSKSPFKVLGLYGDTKKYLKKNKMYPGDEDTEVTYQIDDEWDF